jgi:lysophospholipase L1-like esterase
MQGHFVYKHEKTFMPSRPQHPIPGDNQMKSTSRYILLVLITALFSLTGHAQSADKWFAAWAGSIQGPYPVGNPSAQPDMHFAFPSAETGARDQTFRMIVRPDIWGPQTRLHFSNVLGTRPVTFDGVFVGLQRGSSAVVAGTNQAVSFAGKKSVTVDAGNSVWSDPVALPFAEKLDAIALTGRKLAVSFHVAGESGPMTWHAKALNTSYVSQSGAGSLGQSEDEFAFPFSTASWYFLDTVDMMARSDTQVVVALGDSITDGTATTMNGDDRWADVLARRLHAVYGNRISVVIAGIGGNQVVGPSSYSAQKPFPGGPSAQARVERDVIGLSGVSTVIWLEGINDFSKNGNASVEAVQSGMKEVVARLRARLPGVRVIGATVTSALGSTSAAHGHVEQNEKRKALNDFVRTSEVFDGFVDFDKAVLDTVTGAMQAEFVPESTTGGPGDKLHPNRAGNLTMGTAIDLKLIVKQ